MERRLLTIPCKEPNHSLVWAAIMRFERHAVNFRVKNGEVSWPKNGFISTENAKYPILGTVTVDIDNLEIVYPDSANEIVAFLRECYLADSNNNRPTRNKRSKRKKRGIGRYSDINKRKAKRTMRSTEHL